MNIQTRMKILSSSRKSCVVWDSYHYLATHLLFLGDQELYRYDWFPSDDESNLNQIHPAQVVFLSFLLKALQRPKNRSYFLENIGRTPSWVFIHFFQEQIIAFHKSKLGSKAIFKTVLVWTLKPALQPHLLLCAKQCGNTVRGNNPKSINAALSNRA